MWPKENIPEEYLRMAQKLVKQESVSIREFIDLCLLVIKYTEIGQTTVKTRSDMALYIANLWLRHETLDRDLISDIGGTFGELDTGSFEIDGVYKRKWEDLKSWILLADKQYPRQWPKENIPEEYLRQAQELVGERSVSARRFIGLCLLAFKYIDADQTTAKTRSDMMLYISILWLRHKNIEWEVPDFVIDGPSKTDWEDLKLMITQAAQKYRNL